MSDGQSDAGKGRDEFRARAHALYGDLTDAELSIAADEKRASLNAAEEWCKRADNARRRLQFENDCLCRVMSDRHNGIDAEGGHSSCKASTP